MTLKEILEFAVPVIIYLITFVFQRQKIETLTTAINLQKDGIAGQKVSIDAQTTVISALKGQADGQAAITTKLGTLLEQVEKHAGSVLRDHEAILKIRDQRADVEKQEISKQLEDARSQLETRKEAIKEAGMQPEVASLLTSLSQESFANKEILTGLKSELAQLVSLISNATLAPLELQAPNINSFSLLTENDKEYIKTTVMQAHLRRTTHTQPIEIRNLIMTVTAPRFAESNRIMDESLYKQVLGFSERLGLGPFISYR